MRFCTVTVGTPFWGAPGLAVVDAESGELFSEPDGDDVAASTIGPYKAALFRAIAELDEDQCQTALSLLDRERVLA